MSLPLARAGRTAAALLILLAGATGCGMIGKIGPGDPPASTGPTLRSYLDRSSLAGKTELRIGVSAESPLMGQAAVANPQRLGHFAGFDIDLAAALAKYLGFDEAAVRPVVLKTHERERAIAEGRVDLVVASYSITEAREKVVDFAGPYLISGPKILAPATMPVDGVTFNDLSTLARKLCVVGGSTTVKELNDKGVFGFEAVPGRQECVDGMLSGRYELFMLDEILLAGYQHGHPDKLKIIDVPSSQIDAYGIGLPEGDANLRAAVCGFLLESFDAGPQGAWHSAWSRSLEASLGARSQKDPTATPVPVPRTAGSTEPGQCVGMTRLAH